MCIWSIYLVKFDRVFEGSILSKVENLSNILEILIKSLTMHYVRSS